MKKFLVVFITICLLFSLGACFGDVRILDDFEHAHQYTDIYFFYDIPQSCYIDEVTVYIGTGQRYWADQQPDTLPDGHPGISVCAAPTSPKQKLMGYPGEFGDYIVLDGFIDDLYSANKYIWIEGIDNIGAPERSYTYIGDHPDKTIYIPYLKSFTIPAEFFTEQSHTFYIMLCDAEFGSTVYRTVSKAIGINYTINGNCIAFTTTSGSYNNFPQNYIAYSNNG